MTGPLCASGPSSAKRRPKGRLPLRTLMRMKWGSSWEARRGCLHSVTDHVLPHQLSLSLSTSSAPRPGPAPCLPVPTRPPGALRRQKRRALCQETPTAKSGASRPFLTAAFVRDTAPVCPWDRPPPRAPEVRPKERPWVQTHRTAVCLGADRWASLRLTSLIPDRGDGAPASQASGEEQGVRGGLEAVTARPRPRALRTSRFDLCSLPPLPRLL